MDFSSAAVINAAFNFDPTQNYRAVSNNFGQFHLNPINVALHFITTPLGLVGLFNVLYIYTKSSSFAITLMSIYLLSLLPAVPNGVFAGTAILCGVILLFSRSTRLSLSFSIILVILGYVLQDLSHYITGEATYQSSYSAGGQVDFRNPILWAGMLFEHCYYLLPLCVHVALPLITVPDEVRSILEAPLPVQMQHLNTFAWLLGPLVCCALGSYCLDSKNCFCFFPGAPYFYRVAQCNLLNTDEIESDSDKHKDFSSESNEKTHHQSYGGDLDILRAWAMAHNPSANTSTHWWYSSLSDQEHSSSTSDAGQEESLTDSKSRSSSSVATQPSSAKAAFDRVTNSTQIESMFRSLFSKKNYCMDAISGMNEIYVSGPARSDETSNSDHVFYTRHVDGPFGLVPFVSVYRCIVGMDRNDKITTHFPLANMAKNACKGDVLAFDFNREVHYISATAASNSKTDTDGFRVTLKLHYCIYPRVLAPLGWLMHVLNTRYNQSFRALFLKTLKPSSPYEHLLAWNVNFSTMLYDRLETLFGQRNVIYLIFVFALWRATGIYEVFFALTSFVHYFRYISTFYVRKDIDFGSFKRDVLLFKTIAVAQLLYHYFFPGVNFSSGDSDTSNPFVFDCLSLGMIVVGYATSVMATNAIGIDRTYFGAELGLVEPKWINQFPYGYIPHPMILSQIVALLGMHKAAHFRAQWPYAVPMHVTMYLIHMTQEHFNIYQHYPEQE